MVTSMDDAIGRVVTALKQKGIYNNTLIVFTSDNGGWTPYGGNNFPLRGGKASLFEGGARVPAFIHGALLNNSGAVYDGVGDYKLFEGFPGVFQDWYRPGAPDQGLNITLEMTLSLDWLSQVPDSDGNSSFLFNLKDDPTEQNNLYDQLLDVVKTLHDKLVEESKRYVPPNWPADSPKADPDNYGGIWTPGWC